MATFLCLDWPIRACLEAPITELLACELRSCQPPEKLIGVFDGGRHTRIRGVFGCAQRVPDVDRYRVVQEGDQLRLENHPNAADDFANETPEQDYPCNQTLVVLLESPHRDEFDRHFTPRGPAMGATGRSIRKGLIDALERNQCVRRRVVPDTRVIIANPVQFQTSLFVIHRNRSVPACRRTELRDAVWNAIWGVSEVQEDFIARIRGYRPHTILNLCTGTNDPTTLNGKVTSRLRDDGFEEQLFVGQHPSWPKWTNCATFARPD